MYYKQSTHVDVSSFVQEHSSSLLHGCEWDNEFSHCQHHLVFVVNPGRRECKTWNRQKCVDSPNASCDRFGTRVYRYHCSCSPIVMVILLMECSFDRISRVYYINKRWKGPIIYSILFCDRESSDLYRFLEQRFDERVTFIVYMCALKEGEPYIIFNNTHILKTSGHPYLYPFNILRSLGIEYIQTTHYLLLDCDIFISGL